MIFRQLRTYELFAVSVEAGEGKGTMHGRRQCESKRDEGRVNERKRSSEKESTKSPLRAPRAGRIRFARKGGEGEREREIGGERGCR